MNNTGCLLIHGFAGSRRELEPLRRCLMMSGYLVDVPVLSGHESTTLELRKASRHDWINGAQAALDKLRLSCETVVIIGFSMGGLIATNLYQNNIVDGIVFINTPVYYWNLPHMILNLYSDFRPYLKKYLISFRDIPLHAMLEFQLLLNRTKPMFDKIGCRALVLQTMDDDTVNPKSAEYIYSRLSGHKEIKKVPVGGHVVLLNKGKDQVCSQVQHFLKDVQASLLK
jgi:carboxylesterase